MINQTGAEVDALGVCVHPIYSKFDPLYAKRFSMKSFKSPRTAIVEKSIGLTIHSPGVWGVCSVSTSSLLICITPSVLSGLSKHKKGRMQPFDKHSVARNK